jgi:polysaccharide biosynthesis/export protein
MIRRIDMICLLALIILWPVLSSAQESSPPMNIPEAAGQLAEYRVGPGDLLSIRVFGLTQFDQTARISNSGRIHIRYAGILHLADMTVAQIGDEIAKILRERQLVKEPWVAVQVVEYNAQPVFVVGEVTAPGQFVITGEMRLLDVITKARGFRPNAGDEVLLIRRSSHSGAATKDLNPNFGKSSTDSSNPNSHESATDAEATEKNERIAINITQLTDGSRPELNARLRGGDIIYIPAMPLRVIYLIGEVRNPGAYVLPHDYKHITAASAIAYAGGTPRETAKTNKVCLIRRDSNGVYQTVKYDLSKIIKGEEPDIPVKPDDILLVPRSLGKMIAYKLFDMVGHMTHQMLIF